MSETSILILSSPEDLRKNLLTSTIFTEIGAENVSVCWLVEGLAIWERLADPQSPVDLILILNPLRILSTESIALLRRFQPRALILLATSDPSLSPSDEMIRLADDVFCLSETTEEEISWRIRGHLRVRTDRTEERLAITKWEP